MEAAENFGLRLRLTPHRFPRRETRDFRKKERCHTEEETGMKVHMLPLLVTVYFDHEYI